MSDKQPEKPKPFTEKIIRELEPRSSRYFAFDPAMPGFGVRVFPGGNKTFVYFYRKGIRKRMATLGRVGMGGVTLDQARRGCGRRWLALSRPGKTPSGQGRSQGGQ